jgi:hypothetical protein
MIFFLNLQSIKDFVKIYRYPDKEEQKSYRNIVASVYILTSLIIVLFVQLIYMLFKNLF